MAGEGGEERAIVNALKNDAEKSIPQAAEHISGFTGDTAATLRGQLESTQSLESSVRDSFDGLNPENAGKDLMQRTTSTGVQRDVQYYRFSEQELKEAGITSNGVDRIEVGKTDPVDVVSGQLVAATLDVLRRGVLPLMLRSSGPAGRAPWTSGSWSSRTASVSWETRGRRWTTARRRGSHWDFRSFPRTAPAGR
jgi:hypothetical protein